VKTLPSSFSADATFLNHTRVSSVAGKRRAKVRNVSSINPGGTRVLPFVNIIVSLGMKDWDSYLLLTTSRNEA
jgi:hypothetical protein